MSYVDPELEEPVDAFEDAREDEEGLEPAALPEALDVELDMVEEFLEARYAFGAPAAERVVFPSGVALPIVTDDALAAAQPDGGGAGVPLLDTRPANQSLRLAADFTVGEFARSGATTFDRARIDPELVRCVQALRNSIGRPVQITSGYRPAPLDAELRDDQHLAPTTGPHASGRAVDIRVEGLSGAALARAATRACGGAVTVHPGPGFAHLHLRPQPAAGVELDPLERRLESDSAIPPARTSGGAAAGPWVFLVSGFDYQLRGLDYQRSALNRRSHLIERHRAAHAGDTATMIATMPRFRFFDVGTGLIREHTATGRNGTWTWNEVERFRPVTIKENYARRGSSRAFTRNAEGRMSITDVYRHVRALGITEPGSLKELSFFSHGAPQSVVLVNSFEPSPEPATRDPSDKDGRTKDFDAINMSPQALRDLRAAFSTDGFVWVWGCAMARSAHQVLARVLKNEKFRTARAGGLADTDEVTLVFSRDEAKKIFHVDPDFFPPPGPDGRQPLRFRRSFAQIRAFLLDRIGSTYAAAIAVGAGVPCFGALPGTYSEDDKRSPRPLPLIPASRHQSDDFRPTIRFYTRHLGVKLDPEGRNYGRYEP
ncbi:MAG: hypothetical protein AVDCRST_MAG67-2070 [uncultured Solirubrobacteraceae bacterium]|uniref:Peptidase M15A C-terminal domain-containing protein n=1 Tax=uncultured Solirubrobacteraceae bacterium TaxID=1162706 RepID=A0A6J4RYE2_9ACTN|nr:MAG: hypothetical protein AVDCRST_MAG67-2070 [uncultured Solirubrobacteraceae bacterium]